MLCECPACGVCIAPDGNGNYVDSDRFISLDMIDHNWDEGTVKKAATCVSEGSLEQSCIICKQTKQITIEPSSHRIITISRPATCKVGASITTLCKDCGLVISFSEETDVIEHLWSEKTFIPPTCTDAGSYKVECLRDGCGVVVYQELESYPPFGHKFAELPAEESTPFYEGLASGTRCTICGYYEHIQFAPKLEIPVMNLPKALKQISEEAFAGSVMQAVDIPDGCTSIDKLAFADCTNLRWIRIPDSVTDIADNAFESCTDLTFVCSANSTAAGFAKANGFNCITH